VHIQDWVLGWGRGEASELEESSGRPHRWRRRAEEASWDGPRRSVLEGTRHWFAATG
jgi:hypothetical protein